MGWARVHYHGDEGAGAENGTGQHVCSPHLALPRVSTPSRGTEGHSRLCIQVLAPTIAGSLGQVSPSYWAPVLSRKAVDLGRCPLKPHLGSGLGCSWDQGEEPGREEDRGELDRTSAWCQQDKVAGEKLLRT